jgi:hypothetical protein
LGISRKRGVHGNPTRRDTRAQSWAQDHHLAGGPRTLAQRRLTQPTPTPLGRRLMRYHEAWRRWDPRRSRTSAGSPATC